MSSITTGHKLSWPQFNQTDREFRRERSRPTSRHNETRNWSIASAVQSFIAAICLALYSILSLCGAVAGIMLAILAIPILIFGPVFLVGAFLQAATWVFQGFGLV